MLKQFSSQVGMVSKMTLEDSKAAIREDVGSPPISDINTQVYNFV